MSKQEKIALLICVLFAAGETLGFALPAFATRTPFFALATLLAALFSYGLRLPQWWLAPFFFLGLTLSTSVMSSRMDTLRTISNEPRYAPYTATFQVEADPTFRGKSDASTRWTSFLSSYSNITLHVIAPIAATNAPPRLGETWQCTGWFRSSPDPTETRPRKFWVKGRNTSARCITPAPAHSLRGTFNSIRHNLSHRMGLGLEHSPGIADLNRAILLGERATLPSSIRDTFVRAGTMHVFAISGLHVMIIAQLLLTILTCCAVPVRFSGFLLIPLLWAYTYLIGMTPSAIRAAGMASIYFAAYIFMRRPNAILAWCLTFLIIHILDPIMLLNVGSELSFAVMLGILLSLRLCAHFNFDRAEGLIVTIAAWLAGTPIAAHVFGRITPGGILANIVLIPTASVSVITSALGLLSSFISTTLASHINNLSALFTRAMVAISWFVANLPGSNFESSHWTFFFCLAWYALFLGLPTLLVSKTRSRRRAKYS